ncbi:MAG TPA: cupredoxin domain-containing protein [Candidatus Saccharimonadales bacterium]|nr:cupredoxin domain-containing protein [Candidatus Saccharimonadales bacterium]
MRSLRPAFVVLAIIAVAACTATQPGWTVAPPPSGSLAPAGSGQPPSSGEPSAATSGAPSAAASGAPSAPASGGPSAAASIAPSAPASAAPSSAATAVDLTAAAVAFDKTELAVPADQPFQIVFNNNDASIPHNVAIHQGSATGPAVFTGEVFPGVETRTYDVPALPAGAYGFICTVHPNMVGTLTAG